MKYTLNPNVSRHLLRYLPLKGLILDAGCGDFTYAHFLRSYTDMITCVDVFNSDVDEARKNRFLLATVEDLPFKAESFYFVYALSLLQFVRNDTAAIEEFHRILKPGGRLLLTVPTSRSMFRLLRDLEIRFGVYRYPRFDVAGHHYYSRGGIRKLTSGKFRLIDVNGYDYNFVPRLHTFLIAILRRSRIVRWIWKSLPKRKSTHLTETTWLGNSSEDIRTGPEEPIKVLEAPENRLGPVIDCSYHYIAVLEKPWRQTLPKKAWGSCVGNPCQDWREMSAL